MLRLACTRAAEKLSVKTRAEIVRYGLTQGWREHLADFKLLFASDE
jgi:hypothetical protein